MIEFSEEQKKQLERVARDMSIISSEIDTSAELLAKELINLANSVTTFYLAVQAAMEIFNDRDLD